MRNLFAAFLLALFCLLPGGGAALAYPSEQEIIQRANEETNGHFADTNVAGRPLALRQLERGQVQGRIWAVVDRVAPGLPLYVPAWGEPHGDERDGQPRYLGYTYWDEDFTNPAFPHDAWAGGKLEDRNWIEEPWRKVPGQQENDFDGKPKYREAIALGLLLYYGDVVYGPKLRPEFWGGLERYVHVLAPPSYYTWGMGRMWHRLADGSVWYLSVPIAPTGMLLGADLAVRIEPAEVTARPGDEVTFTAYLKLKRAPGVSDFFSGYAAWTPGEWHADGVGAYHLTDQAYDVALEPQAGSPALDEWGTTEGWMEEGREYAYAVKVHAQEAPSEVWVMGFPGLPAWDADPSDNLAVAKINVETANLAVRNLTLDPNPCDPGALVAASAEIVNEGSQDVTTVARWIFEGQVVMEQEVSIPAGGYNVTQAQIRAPQEPGTYAVGVLANPNRDKPANEKTYDDNYAEGYLTVEEPCTDVSVQLGLSDAGVPNGGTITAYVEVRRANDGPGRPVGVQVRVTAGGASKTWGIRLERGQDWVDSATFWVNNAGPELTIRAEAWPQDAEDCAPGNNRASERIAVEQPPDAPQPDKKGIFVRLIR